MQRLRTIKRVVPMLVALFVVAQLAGVAPSPLTGGAAAQAPTASHVHHQHPADERGKEPSHHHDHDADYCCALHAFFAGVMPPEVIVERIDTSGRRLDAKIARFSPGISPDRLDRPPRPLQVI
jgi:hypothetical protein